MNRTKTKRQESLIVFLSEQKLCLHWLNSYNTCWSRQMSCSKFHLCYNFIVTLPPYWQMSRCDTCLIIATVTSRTTNQNIISFQSYREFCSVKMCVCPSLPPVNHFVPLEQKADWELLQTLWNLKGEELYLSPWDNSVTSFKKSTCCRKIVICLVVMTQESKATQLRRPLMEKNDICHLHFLWDAPECTLTRIQGRRK